MSTSSPPAIWPQGRPRDKGNNSFFSLSLFRWWGYDMWPVVTTTSAATLSLTVRVVAGDHQRLCAASMTSMDAKRAPKLVQATSTRCTVHTTRAAAWTLRGFQSRSAELLKLLCLCHGRITLAFKKPEFVRGLKVVWEEAYLRNNWSATATMEVPRLCYILYEDRQREERW